MMTPKDFEIGPSSPSSNHRETKSISRDEDTLKLAEMGYTQDMKRNFSVLSLVGVGFSLLNSWFGISASLITGIYSGGTVLTIYGIPLITFITTCVGVTLSELASAMPSAGGQYFWANELAPRKYANFASYLTGWLAWVGSIFSSASVALGVGAAGVGMWQLAHPHLYVIFAGSLSMSPVSNISHSRHIINSCGLLCLISKNSVPQPWHTVVAYEVVNLSAYPFNCVGKVLPRVATVSLYISLVSFMVILITVPATAPTHSDVKFVFATFVNSTGWSSDSLAFIVGLINPNWVFSCLDAVTHMAEEIGSPEKAIPIAIMGTVAIAFVTSWFYCISMFFSISDLGPLLNTATGVPILELYYQALRNKAGAITLESLVFATGIGCLVASHTWQSRLCWSFARDRGLPGHQYLAKVHPQLDVPLIAHTVSCFIVALLGLLYLGSSTAFNSMVAACIVLIYISYAIPITTLLIQGRNNIKHGPFWLGAIGHLCNWIVLGWTLFTFVMFSLPSRYPATADCTLNSFSYSAVWN